MIFFNESDKASVELEAIYFYNSKGWTLYQDDKECSSTDSDIADYDIRHFLKPPVRKLHKNAWAQVTFYAQKIIVFATKGEELKDSYRVSGISLLRLVTAEGNFDYEIPVDTTVDDLSF